MNYQQMLWLKRIREHRKEKELADKCGLSMKEICVHEWITGRYMVKHCRRCGVISDEA